MKRDGQIHMFYCKQPSDVFSTIINHLCQFHAKKELQFREIILDEKSGKLDYLTKKINNVIPLFKHVKVTDDGNVAISKKKDDRKRRNLQRYSIKWKLNRRGEILQAKSRKYQGVFEVKSRVKTWQVLGIWSQQLEHKQVPRWGTEPGVRKGKRSLLACHTHCKCSMETTHNHS